jgi:4-aminobutyrate aminotransferase-like enzyme
VYKDEDLIRRAAALGSWLRARLGSLAAARPYVREVRGLGLLWALELGEPGAGASGAAAPARMKALAEGLRRRCLHLHKRDHMVFLAPPLVASEADLETGLARLCEALNEAFAGGT